MSSRVILTRPVGGPYSGVDKLTGELLKLGFKVQNFTALRVVVHPIARDNLSAIEAFLVEPITPWLVFLSPTAVWVWCELAEINLELASFTKRAAFAVQGQGTASACLECFGRQGDFQPQVAVAEQFVREFAKLLSQNQRVLVPQSANGRNIVVPALQSQGFKAHGFSSYSLVDYPVSDEEMMRYREFVNHPDSAIVFMSPSAVRAVAAKLQGLLGTDKIVSIGPTTSEALNKAGFKVWREAREHSESGIVECLKG